MATKAGGISTLYLLENDYVGDIIEYPVVTLQLQYIPRSDSVFESIYVSQLNVTIDVTDNEDNMPNFITLNDRKYLSKLFYNDVLEWQGWTISDIVNLTFTTGRKELSFDCIDGLGILEKIKYPLNSNTTLVDQLSLLNFITTCLAQIQFPIGLDIMSCISYFATGMNTRSTSVTAEPFSQTYMRFNNIINNDYTSIDCLTILDNIIKSFGGRLFQAEGKWWIISVNEFAQPNFYFTRYNYLGVVQSDVSNIIDKTITIQHYEYGTNNPHFVENSQTKILKKGYNKILYKKDIEYPDNYISNGNIKSFIGNDISGWNETIVGAGEVLVKEYPELDANSVVLKTLPTSSDRASIQPTYLPKLNFLDLCSLSFDVVNVSGPRFGTGEDVLFIDIFLTDSSSIYFLYKDDSGNPVWIKVGGINYPFPRPYHVSYLSVSRSDFDVISGSINIDFPEAPIVGDLTIKFWIGAEATDHIELRNFRLNNAQKYKSIETVSFIQDIAEYVIEPDMPYGYNFKSNFYLYYIGNLNDANGDNLYGWNRYEYTSNAYRNLCELIVKQYANIYYKNIINIDCSFSGLETPIGRFSAATRILVEDSTLINSVSGKKYMLGNTTIDFFNDQVNTTLLEIENTNIDTVVTTKYITSNNALVYGYLRSSGYSTYAAAAAASYTTNKVYLYNNYLFTDFYLINKFNGGSLYYKVQYWDLVGNDVLRIDSDGKII